MSEQIVVSHEDYLKYQQLQEKNISLSRYMKIKGYEDLPHKEKYENVVRDIGYDAVKRCIPFSREQIKKALENGDEHLNSLPISKWDTASGFRCSGANCTLIRSELTNLYMNIGINAFSCAQGVCILKEAARMWAEEP